MRTPPAPSCRAGISASRNGVRRVKKRCPHGSRLAGIWLFITYVLAGILSCIFIITIPFGVQSFKLASLVIWPFGRTVADRPGASALGSGCGNILWFVLGGWYLALTHFLTGVLLCIPIITIPLAIRTSSSADWLSRPSVRRS